MTLLYCNNPSKTINMVIREQMNSYTQKQKNNIGRVRRLTKIMVRCVVVVVTSEN